MFQGFIAIFITYHAYHNDGKEQFKIRSKESCYVPNYGEIENSQLSQFQREKAKEINFDGG